MRRLELLKSAAQFCTIAALALSACACAGSAPATEQQRTAAPERGAITPAAQPPAALPIPSALDAIHRAAGLSETLVQGKFTLLRSSGAVDNGSALDLVSSSAMEWGLYAFDPEGNAPDSVSVSLDVPLGDSAWVGLPDYSLGVWEWHGPLSAGKTLAVDEARYLSPGGLLYCTVAAASGNSATVNALSVRTINPQNVAPSADLQADVLLGDAPLTVNFDASASSDSDGQIVEYAWDFDGNGSYEEFTDSPQLSHTYTTPGIRSVRMRVSDEQFARSSDTVDIGVTDPFNNGPNAVVQFGAENLAYGEHTLTYDASPSDAGGDAGDSIVLYEWDWDANGYYDDRGTQATIDHTFTQAGQYRPILRVTDSAGNQDTAVAEEYSIYPPPNTVDVTGASFDPPALITVSGYPAIAYRSADDSSMLFRRALDDAGSEWGPPVTIDAASPSGDDYISIAIIGGNPAVAYYDLTNTQLMYARAANPLGNSWNPPVLVENAGDSGAFCSLGTANGNPCIAYQRDNGLYYVQASNPNGTAWLAPVPLETTGVTGRWASLANVDDAPAICYWNSTDNEFKYIRANDPDGASWGTALVLDDTSTEGSGCCLTLVSGYPAVSYHPQTPSELRYKMAQDPDGSVWNPYVLVDDAGGAGAGGHSSMAIVDNNPAIAYVSTGDVMPTYIRANSSSGDDWGKPIRLSPSGFNGYFNRMAIVNGQPAVCSRRVSTGELLYFSGF